jgi:ATP-binding cassette subfamily F protein 3
LLESLEKFTGTVVFVSHDRYFIDKLATRVFEIGAGEVHIFPGNYEDYMWRKEGKTIDLTLPSLTPSTNHQPPATTASNAKRLNPIKLQQMRERCGELEEKIASLETEIAACEEDLASFVSAEETMRVSSLLEKRRADLSGLLAEWEQVTQVVESHRA